MQSLAFMLLLLLPPQDAGRDRLDVAIPMRDGKTLAADVYLPAREGAYPTVLIQTPYAKSRMRRMMTRGEGYGGEVARGSETDMAVFRDRENYAYVIVDWRGFYESKDAAVGVRRPIRRGRDGYDCIEWIARQPWSNGKVGTWGGSALGRIQLETAIEQPPHLVCAAPLIAPMGQAYEHFYDGGVLLEAHVKRLGQLGFDGLDVVKHIRDPDAPAWKLAWRVGYRPQAVEVPCLFITGWWDHHPASIIATFEDVRASGGGRARESKLLIGPWDHVSIGVDRQGDLAFPGAAKASGYAAKAFFDRWLRGVEGGWDAVEPVRWWQIGEDAWMAAESWSGVPRASVTIALGGGSYASDPADPSPTLGGANLPPLPHGPTDHGALDARRDGLVWKLPREDALRVNGSITLTFDASWSGDTCDFIARLCDVRDGRPYHVADAAARVRGAKGTVTLTFPPVALTSRELRLYLTATNAPRYEMMAAAASVTVAEGARLAIPTLR